MDSLFEFYPASLDRDKAPRGLISIPHSGLKIPSEYRDYFIKNDFELNCDVDLGVHECLELSKLQLEGIHVIKYNFHRTFIDLNRSRDTSLQNWEKNTRGVDLIVKRIENDQAVLEKYWDPYFFIIEQFIENNSEKFPIIDLHSMPSKATDYHLKKNPNQPVNRPPFCLSDFKGKTAPKEFTDLAHKTFVSLWPESLVNDPYFGGYITQHFEKFPNPNIQIEINRSLYMNEINQELNPQKIEKFRNQLTDSLIQFFKSWSAAKNESV